MDVERNPGPAIVSNWGFSGLVDVCMKILTVTSNPHHCPCLCTFRCDLLAMQIDNIIWFISGTSYCLLASDLLD